MKKEEEDYGIYFNEKVPKLDKINKYSKEVEIKFEGKAYLIERDDDDDDEIIERIEIENEYVLKKEKDYEIEFTNKNNEMYSLQIRIEISYWFLFLLFFLFGFIIILLLYKPIDTEVSPLVRFYDYINFSILQLDKRDSNLEEQPNEQYNTSKIDEKKQANANQLDKKEEKQDDVDKCQKEDQALKQYDFDVTFNGISSDDIHLTDTISMKSLAKNKIAPRNKWQFFNFNQYRK